MPQVLKEGTTMMMFKFRGSNGSQQTCRSAGPRHSTGIAAIAATASLAMLAPLASACGKDAKAATPQQGSDQSQIAAYNLAELATRTSNLSTLVSLASTCNLVGVLADPATNITVFAPTNQAFSKLLGDGPLPETCSDQLKATLLYHIAPGQLRSDAFGETRGFQTLLSQSASSVEQLFIKSDDSGVKINQSSRVSSANIQASNGLVHLIDTVLIPDQNGTVVDALSKREEFASLVKAAVAVNLASALSETPDLTVFAPVNQAFEAVGSPSSEVLTKVLLHHVLGSRVLSSQIVTGSQQAGTLNGDSLTIFGDDQGFAIFGSGQSLADAGRIVATDITTKNGIIHTISKVLIPANIQ
jgi:transforming growth factor-beta-induced protein